MNRNRAALVGLLAFAAFVQAGAARESAGSPASGSARPGVDASPVFTNPATVLTLVNTIHTSSWSPPSPDPAGLTYRTDTGRLLVADSEVDEIPTLFTGQNLFEIATAGALVDTGSLTARTSEPTDIAWDSNARVLYVSDDFLDKIFRINPQADGRFGTPDDTSATTYTTTTFGSGDVEGLAYNPSDRSLWAVDGTQVRVYHLERGADGQFNTADDIITSWDARPVGLHQPEGIAYDAASGHLFLVDRANRLVAEATTTGTLVALYDLSGTSILAPSAITLAPASGGAGTNFYVADRGVDNDIDPAENDGRIFEYTRTVVFGDVAPVAANPKEQFHVEGEVVSLQVIAFEPNGDPLTYSAVDLPDGLSIDPISGLIFGTLAAGAASNSPFSTQVTVSDGSLSDTETWRWEITTGNRPPVIQDIPDQAIVEGDLINLQVGAADPDQDPLTYSALGLPAGLGIDPASGLISGTVAAGTSSGSPYSVQLKATDTGGLFDTEIVLWTVTALPPNQPPVVQNPGNQVNTEGDLVNLQVVANDPEADPLTFSANNLPAGLGIDPGTGLISGTLQWGASAASPYSVQVSANDGGSVDTESFLWTVLAPSCDDSNPCTADSFDPGIGGCVYNPVADGTTCSDGNACTQSDSCQAGSCVGASPVICAAQDQCHEAGVCDPATGLCSNPALPDGTACSDDNTCTQADSCQAGSCVGSSPVFCTAQDQCHEMGVCDPATGLCSNPALPDGTACNDDNACTQADACQAGSCVGSSPVICTAQDQCHEAGVCDPATGLCTNPALPDGAACNDDNACTQTDACQAGTCVGSALPEGTACNDGNACTQIDSCQAGACAGSSPVICTAQDQCHEAGVCDPATGLCTNPALPDGTACNDDNACTQSDACQAGSCVGANPVICAAQDQCHEAGICDPATGLCSNPALPDGTACDDDNACTQSDSCQAGTCVGANPVICAAQDQCHEAGICDSATGLCSNPALPDGTACDDDNACTQSDACQAGTCVGTNAISISEPNPLAFVSAALLSWPATPDATHWNTYRGTIPSTMLGSRLLAGIYDQVCLESGDAFGDGVTMTTDASNPPVGSAYFYLESGEGVCGESDLGHASSGTGIPNLSPCPTPP